MNRVGGSGRDYNMILADALGKRDAASSASQEAHHQMEMIMNTGMKFAGMMMGLLGGIMGGCSGGC